jgi:hypothetical protein
MRVFGIVFVALGVACAGPIAPLKPGDIPCTNNYACPAHYYCGFAGVDTRAICRPGDPDDSLGHRKAK